jgi:short-subunit dehydrogenase
MRLSLAARRVEPLRALAAELEGGGAQALACPTDVRDAAAIEALAAATLARYGRVDALVANAGLGYTGPMARVTDEEIVRTVEVNLLGVMRCVRAVLPAMIEQRRGHLITVSSVAAGVASPRAAVYAATKAGIHRFCEGLRREVRHHGLSVTDVMPGVIDTPMTAHIRGFPKAPVESTARAILGTLRRPRPVIVTPAWYRLALALNAAAPWAVDYFMDRELAKDRSK